MAFRRALSIRSTLTGRQRYQLAFHIIPRDNDHEESSSFTSQRSYHSFLHQQRSSSIINSDLSHFPGGGGGGLHVTSSASAFAFYRYMSSAHGVGSEKMGVINDIAEVITDSATLQDVPAQAVTAVSEVALAANDSFLPIAALQHCIDMVHCYTGLEWWASIVLATVLIRSSTVPLLIKQMKDTMKLSLMKPRLEAIREEMQNKGMDQVTMAEGQKKMKNLFKEYGVTPFTPMKGMLIQGPLFICFFLAIRNMAEKVPSFQTGGALWFTDLTTPDSLYILPVITALTFLITVELNAQEGMEGNPMAGTIKNVFRGFALLTVPMTMSFPQAIFCYWITSNLFSLTYGLVIKRPQVKKMLKIPELPPPPPGQQPSFDLFAALKKMKAMTQDHTENQTQQPSSPVNPRISSASMSPVSRRLKALESQVKGRKKNSSKKR
ncbi:Mitochondrial inner membrane protein OXA1 [Raphanus sativus]|uniref:Mitochondrial inner membrane protein OXA1-like n=1 Tax=Raphanus sativus TaxID=3726 RepID=A0A6J0P567_RAPSA|nr:mitochondrial inner membrane protein OXA1-like [Raphanus sativus]KAJ4872148.1 Mitochondrial inner membrane protein OXA1 [Raphanus sativus]